MKNLTLQALTVYISGSEYVFVWFCLLCITVMLSQFASVTFQKLRIYVGRSVIFTVFAGLDAPSLSLSFSFCVFYRSQAIWSGAAANPGLHTHCPARWERDKQPQES